MSKGKVKCEVCGKKTDIDKLTTCIGCDKKFCEECHSPETMEEYCIECVGMGGVVPQS
jgi:hypothetical protein